MDAENGMADMGNYVLASKKSSKMEFENLEEVVKGCPCSSEGSSAHSRARQRAFATKELGGLFRPLILRFSHVLTIFCTMNLLNLTFIYRCSNFDSTIENNNLITNYDVQS